MKSIFKKLVLITLVSVPCVSSAQSFALDQLVLLSSKSALDIDAYTNARGWKFMGLPANDTSITAGWKFLSNQGRYMLLYEKIGEQPATIIYSTPNRALFDAIRLRLSAYGLKQVETNNKRYGLNTQYMSPKYEVWLRIHNALEEPRKTSYIVVVQKQTKVLLEIMNGESVWMDPKRLILASDSLQPRR